MGKERAGEVERKGRKGIGGEGSCSSENSFEIPRSRSDENNSLCALVTVVVSMPAAQCPVLGRSIAMWPE